MTFEQCKSCGLVVTMCNIQYVIVKHQGKLLRVPVCTVCKEKKEREARNVQQSS